MQHANANRVTTVDFVIETSLSTADAVDNVFPNDPLCNTPRQNRPTPIAWRTPRRTSRSIINLCCPLDPKLIQIKAETQPFRLPAAGVGENDEQNLLEGSRAAIGRGLGPGRAHRPLVARRLLRYCLFDRRGGVGIDQRSPCLGWLCDRRDCRSSRPVGICRT